MRQRVGEIAGMALLCAVLLASAVVHVGSDVQTPQVPKVAVHHSHGWVRR